VIVRAGRFRPDRSGLRVRPFQIAASLAFLITADPAAAEVGAVVSVFNDAQFRGASISGGHPVAVLDLSYDDPTGAYVAASGTAVATSGSVKPLSLQINGGFAKRLRSGITLDLGVAHSDYSHYSQRIGAGSYTEIYAGVTRKGLTARLHLSPHYFDAGTWTLYGEVDQDVALTRKLSLNAHVGLLAPLRTGEAARTYSQYDWRIGLGQQVGRLTLHAAVTGGERFRHYDDRSYRNRAAVIVGASFVL
jgi:uncharacterized protein (TIGR02001 family)